MPRRAIFVSHSTRQPETAAVLDAVRSALAPDFEVKLDRAGLQAGDLWQDRLYEWMDGAHGAVLLLSREALISNFVRIELSVLSWRACREHDFRLIPVLLEDVMPGDLDVAGVAELRLARWQAVRGAGKDAAAIATEVAGAFADLRGLPPRPCAEEALRESLAGLLRASGASSDTLEKIAETAYGAIPSSARGDRTLALTALILGGSLEQAGRAARLLADYADVAKARAAFALASPSWVRRDAARPIAERALGDPAARVVCVNAGREFTVRSYVLRASGRKPDRCWPLFSLSGRFFADPVEEARTELANAYCERLAYDGPDRAERFAAALSRWEAAEQPVFAFFPPTAAVDAALLARLRSAFPTITFFLLAGEPPRPEAAAASPPLAPALAPGEEARAFDLYQTTMFELSPQTV